IVQSSRNYIDWHTENGIQNYIAKSLPADQLLVTISCTFQDVAIDRDVDQIKKMTDAINKKITDERIAQIYALSGGEKQKAFEEMTRDLQAIYSGIDEEEEEESADQHDVVAKEEAPVEEQQSNRSRLTKTFSPKKFVFKQFSGLMRFCSLLTEKMYLGSTLYKMDEEYILLVDFSECESDEQAVAFMLTAEEYDGRMSDLQHDEAYLVEHGRKMIEQNALEVLCSVNA
ncbi:MAG: adaptor protein MecA, partial [Clostridiales bacterium]|nr:adaptor protein MecA [Clostridiales bacterium]